ncbi:MAG TPA: MFS transporter [Acidimicrobiales bacterium]|nr:MFS transporter [Acidimicrobiales bacterium]
MSFPEPGGLRLHEWFKPPVVAVAFLVLAAGFGQFGAVAALGDVAESLGEVRNGDTIAERAGLSGTALGVGLAIIRVASLLSLPLSGLADRVGRRRTLLLFCAAGLVLTAAASLSPTYWWFVAVFAASRPLLTATDTIGEVSAAEQTGAADRAKAIALLAAAYGIGSGLIAVVRGPAAGVIGFRGVFALALVPALLVPFAARRVSEPDRFRAAGASEERPLPVLGAMGAPFRRRLGVVAALVFAVALITGPANSFVFVYAENVLGLSAAATAGMVVAAAPAGLAGLLLGRWAADTLGRRGTGAMAMGMMAVAGIVTYSGARAAVVAGYLGAVAAGSMFAPAAGAMAAELFPTEVRAAVAGWSVAAGVVGAVVGLMAFGAMADAYEEFGRAALALFPPAAAAAALFSLLPETKGRELEEWERD